MKTTISIDVVTKTKLNKFGKFGQSYNDIILQLIDKNKHILVNTQTSNNLTKIHQTLYAKNSIPESSKEKLG